MKKTWYVIFILFLVLTIDVKAATDNCDSTEFARLKELAKKVEFDYEYKMVDDKAVFSINAANLNEDLKVIIIENYYNSNYKEFKNSSTHTATIDNFEPGEKVTVTIKGFVPNWCSGKTILTKTIRIPYYNYYYDEEKCKGHDDFKYCKLLIDQKITQEEFNRQYELYLKNKGEEGGSTVVPTTDNTKMYLIIGGGVLVLIIIVVIVMYIVKRRKKNML